MELAVDVVVAGREVGGQRGVDADCLADVGAIEEGANLPGRFRETLENIGVGEMGIITW